MEMRILNPIQGFCQNNFTLHFERWISCFLGVLCNVSSRKHNSHILCTYIESEASTVVKFNSGFSRPGERYPLILSNSFYSICLSLCLKVFLRHLLSTKYSGWLNFRHKSEDFPILIYFNSSLQTTQIGHSGYLWHTCNTRLMSSAEYPIAVIVMLRQNKNFPQ